MKTKPINKIVVDTEKKIDSKAIDNLYNLIQVAILLTTYQAEILVEKDQKKIAELKKRADNLFKIINIEGEEMFSTVKDYVQDDIIEKASK